MLRSQDTTIIPDGTGRARLGQVGASVLNIKGKLHAIPAFQMAKSTKVDWAKLINIFLECLYAASGKEKVEL